MSSRIRWPVVGMLVMSVLAPSAMADVCWTFSQDQLSAKVCFVVEGTVLKVTLENTSTFDVLNPGEALTGVYFDIDGITLTPLKATLGDGSIVLFPTNDSGVDSNGEIGGEYGYKDDLTIVPTGANAVIAAAGLGDIVGPKDLFPGENLDGPYSPNGVGYGIVSGIGAESNQKMSGMVPLVQDSVVFYLDGLPEGFDPFAIGGVMFNYGTDFNPFEAVIPAPPAAVLGLIGLASVGARRFRKRK